MKIFLFIIFSVNLVWAFPQVSGWVNSPIIVFENKSQAILSKELWLKSPFAVVTASYDQLEFKINTLDSITVYPKSKIQILEFSNETGFVSDLYLLGGEIRFQSVHRSLAKNESFVTIKTPFFEFPAAGVYDFIVKLDMQVPSVEIKVITGVVPVEFFAFEKKLNLKAGERVVFKGELVEAGGAIKFDYLLNNRKAPRGELSEVMKFDPRDFLKAGKTFVVQEAEKKKAVLKKKQDALKKKKAYEATFLCKKPFAQLNQCAWWLETEKCFRKRCNASGAWGDLIERPVTDLCKQEFTVANCDY